MLGMMVTALMLASRAVEVVKVLLEAGANKEFAELH